MKEIVHRIVCDVCEKEYEVDSEVTNLLFGLNFTHSGGYHYTADMEVDILDSDVKMDICSVECLFNYAKKYRDKELETQAEYMRIENLSYFGGRTLPPISGDPIESLEARLIKDGSLPPPPKVINQMIATDSFTEPETVTSNMSDVDDESITLSVSYFMIVNVDGDGNIFLGNSTKPVPLNTCIQFDTNMVVFPTMEDAVIYRDLRMTKTKTTTIVEVICDPVDYHSNDGKVKYCLFLSK